MSRIGKQPVPVPQDVTVKIDGRRVVVEGPLGSLAQTFRPELKIELKEGKVLISSKKEDRLTRALLGTTRNLIANMVQGVTEGFSKVLKIVGTGYRVALSSTPE
ncbi:50S ribosomal protein L6, partial [Candidatus Shapirobacteria bacterium]|nr:50S ribosomal protein L6 [Candidatus Shapirobacteria bacterium]